MVRMIKAIVAGAALVVGSAAVAAPAGAQQMWRFQLAEATNAPNVETMGSGMAMVTLTGNTMRVQATWQDLVSPTTVAHIHCCVNLDLPPLERTAGVATQLPSFPGFPGVASPPGVLSGTYDRTFALADLFNANFIAASGGTVEMATMRLVNGMNAGTAYFNIHTVQYPAGEINGFSQPQAVVPEPSTYALLGTGIAGLGLVARRRRSRA